MEDQNQIEIYQSDDGTSKVDVSFKDESAWLSLQQMADVFDRDKSVISRHIKNIFESGELLKDSTVTKYATVQAEGGRKVKHKVKIYNLDAIISECSRLNSAKATQFQISDYWSLFWSQ